MQLGKKLTSAYSVRGLWKSAPDVFLPILHAEKLIFDLVSFSVLKGQQHRIEADRKHFTHLSGILFLIAELMPHDLDEPSRYF